MFISIACALALLATPLYVVAEGVVDQTNPVIITEVQTGAATENDEFVELYNTSDAPVDITGWHVRYAEAGSAPDATMLLAEVTASGSNRIILAGHSYFVLRTPGISLPTGVAGQTYTPKLDKSDKTVALFARNETQCQMMVQDAVAWKSAAGTTFGEGPAVPATQSAAHILLQRHLDGEGVYVDTNNNAHDFSLAAGTPGADNPGSNPPGGEPGQGNSSLLAPFAASNCTGPGDPDPNEGLDPLVITELLPNPDAPLSEPNDEFIELYNPNGEAFQLEGYTIEVASPLRPATLLPKAVSNHRPTAPFIFRKPMPG